MLYYLVVMLKNSKCCYKLHGISKIVSFSSYNPIPKKSKEAHAFNSQRWLRKQKICFKATVPRIWAVYLSQIFPQYGNPAAEYKWNIQVTQLKIRMIIIKKKSQKKKVVKHGSKPHDLSLTPHKTSSHHQLNHNNPFQHPSEYDEPLIWF